MNTKLQASVAKILDETHVEIMPRNVRNARWTLACWLDGQPIKQSYILALVKYLRQDVFLTRR